MKKIFSCKELLKVTSMLLVFVLIIASVSFNNSSVVSAETTPDECTVTIIYRTKDMDIPAKQFTVKAGESKEIDISEYIHFDRLNIHYRYSGYLPAEGFSINDERKATINTNDVIATATKTHSGIEKSFL